MEGPLQTARQIELRSFAAAMPDAFIDFTFGDVVAKVGKRIFAYLGTAEFPAMTVKLVASHVQALTFECVAPTGYGLARHGWVTCSTDSTNRPPLEVMQDWIDESYCLVASKRLVALREELMHRPVETPAGSQRSHPGQQPN